MTATTPRHVTASIVIPAHDEESTIGRLLTGLLVDAAPAEFEIIVVCNGCTDRTAEIAKTFGPSVRVVEEAEPSKRTALRVGDQQTTAFPRLYVDADIELGTAAVRLLIQALSDGELLACAPERYLSREGVGPLAARYYDVWERLPQVRSGLFGRGVVAVSLKGHQRIACLPEVMSDDLAMSEAFAEGERGVVQEACVVVHPARTIMALLKRRVRVANGNEEIERQNLRSREARTTMSGLLRLATGDRAAALGLPVFLAVTVAARVTALIKRRSGQAETWQRDKSSRIAAPYAGLSSGGSPEGESRPHRPHTSDINEAPCSPADQ